MGKTSHFLSSMDNWPSLLVDSPAKTICHHIDGIAIGTTVQSLATHDVFGHLKKARSPLNVNHLADKVGARKGYFQVALRLLAHQGFLKLSGPADLDCVQVRLTDEGVAWLGLVQYYDQTPQLLAFAQEFRRFFPGRSSYSDFAPFFPEIPDRLESSPLSRRVELHVYGPLVSVIMTELQLGGILDKLLVEQDHWHSLDIIHPNPFVAGFVAQILEVHGWAKNDNFNRIVLTKPGRLAASWAAQYFYPVSYLTTFRQVPKILFGSRETKQPNDGAEGERHVDRSLDIKFSGVVFEKACKHIFLEAVLPIFNRTPVSDQPACVVDTGSGDGTLLLELFRAVKTQTLRGRFLDTSPLLLVGTEFTRVARESTRAALEGAGFPAKTIFGDIGDPSGLSERLWVEGIDPTKALHISKSVIHNRIYRIPRKAGRCASWKPVTKAPFSLPCGDMISPAEMECNLIELFEDWRPFTEKHGMVVIEAHTVDPELVSNHVGENIITCMDATHGYSHQYLIESKAFLRAAMTAGYMVRFYREIGGKILGQPALTVNHFIPQKS